MRWHFFVLAGSAVALLAGATAAQSSLPLKKVRLYETGVAYFEREGALAGGAGARLPVPAGHLDDALKTLVVLSPDGTARVSGVEFSSSVSPTMARALAGLPEEGNDALGFRKLLESLKGAAVEVQTARAKLTGRVVEVVNAEQSELGDCVEVKKLGANGEQPSCVATRHAALLLLGKTGEIHRLKIAELASVKPTDPAVVARLASAVDALSHRGAQARRELRVLSGASKQVALGYIAETPIWRSTYRLVLADKDQGALQGWALLHNDTDEDWKQVKVELVNGRPDSFLFPLAAPRYARRDLVTPENELSTVPQLLDTTVDAMWSGDGAGGLGISGYGQGGGGRGQGIGLGSIGTVGHGAGVGMGGSGTASSSLLSVGSLAAMGQAEGVEAGALFQYALTSAVDLRAHGSALVPFANETVGARRIAWFSRAGETARSGVHLKNESTQTLPPGPLSIFADGGFAGETAIDRLKPKEARLLAYGMDLDVELTTTSNRHSDESKLLLFRRAQLIEHFVRKHKLDYELENRSGSGRVVYLTLGYVDNAKLSGADELGYDTASRKAFAVFRIPARAKQNRKLDAEEGLSRTTPFAKLSSASLKRFAAAPTLPSAQREIASQAATQLREAEQRRAALRRDIAEIAQLKLEIARMRENVRAVSGAKSGAPLVARLIAAEDRLKGMRRGIVKLRAEADQYARGAQSVLAKLEKVR
jgi:hypothetical protein